MPHRRGQGRGQVKSTRKKTAKKRETGGLDNAYRDMLAEAAVDSSPTQIGDEGTPIKRRRIRGQVVTREGVASDQTGSSTIQLKPATIPQTTLEKDHDPASLDDKLKVPVAIAATESLRQEQTALKDDSSDESDFAWEEVDLAQEADQISIEPTDQDGEGALELFLNGDENKDREATAAARRKPLTAAERKLRLEIHKVHLLCLLSHVHLRNHWCNDQNVHKVLYRRLAKEIVSLLDPDEKLPQFRQDEVFRKGLEKASQSFRNAFTITARGMSRPYWVDDGGGIAPEPPSDLDLPMQKQDFLDCATKLQGSRDVGAQLFCALLRSAGVDTRLVCSLQVLPLSATGKGVTPQKPLDKIIPVIDYNPPSSDNDSDHRPQHPSPPPSKRPIGSTGGLTRFSNPNPRPISPPPRPRPPKRKTFPSSPSPIFWPEVFNPHTQKYLPIDPLVTHTINKPSALTPPLSDPLNTLTYAIAFSDDLAAKDVTRRYTRSYAAKVLKMRVDLTPRGKEWLDCVLQLFQYRGGNGIRSNKSDKDLLEDNELARKEASEPMPRNIQDFKSHPVYALERHLRRNEVIHPRREVGKVSSSTSSTQKSESVFRRKDVHICRTAEQWFRLGQEIKESEQPMKRLLPRSARQQRQRRNPSPLSDDEEEDQEGKPLYLEQQTKVYIPPPIPPAGYPIPRNAYGNLDVYTASMVPERGYHSPHPSTAQAANILGVEAVDAVTGFKFSGRKGKALITGAVIWENHRAALEAVLSGLEDMRREEEEGRWRGVVLGVWRRMLLGLRIRRRVAGYEIEGEREESEEKEREEERLEVARWEGGEEGLYGNDGDDGEEDEGGGFLPDRGGEEAMPTAGRGRGRRMLLDEESEGSDVYVPSDRDGAEGDYRRNQIPAVRVSGKRRRASSTEEDNEAGGFLQDAADAGGGFMPDDDQDHAGVFLAPDEDITVPSADQPQRREELLIATAKKRAEEERPQQQELQPRSENLQLPRSAALAGDPSFKEEETKPKDGKPFAEDEGNGVVPADVLLQRTLKDAELEEATMLQQLYETQSHHPPADAPPFERLPEQDVINNGNGGNGVGDVENVAVAENGSGNVDMVHHVDRDEGEVTQEEEVATQSEKGSLMSEDPDDEDAEPDWLV